MAVYATSDWHGCGNVANKVFDFLKPNDKLYFLGDAIDRGPDGIKLFNRLVSDSRVIMIKGNHEELMEQCLPALVKNENHQFTDHWLFSNGGLETWTTIKDFSKEKIMNYVRMIQCMPLSVEYISPKGHKVILEHAGYSPFIASYRTHNPVWDRSHFYDNWSDELGYEEGKNVYLVHGHTPVQYLKAYYGYKDQPAKTIEDYIEERQYLRDRIKTDEDLILPQVIQYCDGHKFDIDMCTIASHRIALLNLDTFERIYFDDEKAQKERNN